MKPYQLEVLKQIALKGGINDFISLSTSDLGKLLGISQQSASIRILELSELGLVSRELGARAQKLRLTRSGLDILMKEYADYQHIFEMKDIFSIKGTVTSGLGEGQYYMQQKGYNEQFKEKLNIKPFLGTLNLRLTGENVAKLDVLKRSPGVLIEGFKDGGRTFGGVRAYAAKIDEVDCAVIVPERSIHTDILEVISTHHLRKTLKLRDGDPVELRISL
jgi:riboflavin kinase